jgi:hypothetical protein
MYKEYLKIKPNKVGKGVYATVQIPANVPILEFRGPLLAPEGVTDPNKSLQVGPFHYLGPSGEVDDYINHSCRPNCYVHATGKRAVLYSLYLIQPGSELTYDYATTSTDTLDTWQMNCKCGEQNCRQVISGHQHIDWDTHQTYQDKGILPSYITNPDLFKR